MPARLTVITPCAPEHEHLLAQCRSAVEAQTVPVEHLIMVDHERRGPGAIRNHLLRKVQTEFVTFLDADDWLEPDFAAVTIASMLPGRYVYTGWYEGDKARTPPQYAWTGDSWHVVTAVVRTEDALSVGGFDEDMRGMEDTDFWVKIQRSGVCGLRINKALMHYRPGGGRGKAIHETGEVDELRKMLIERHGRTTRLCDGDNRPLIVGDQREGDVLAMPTWQGNRKAFGKVTGRSYGRVSDTKLVWVAEKDVEAQSHLWTIVEKPAPKLAGLIGLSQQMLDIGYIRKEHPKPPTPVAVAAIPNVNRILRIMGQIDLPTFVTTGKRYASYTDLYRLIELGGFALRHVGEVDLNDKSQTYIFVGPDGLPDCTDAKARTVFWQFEYYGEYSQQANRETVDERWSSDPADTKRTGVKFVLCGSHPGLNPSLCPTTGDKFDITMLAYMIPRRQQVKHWLKDLRWPPEHIGHGTQARHQMLMGTRTMLHVHQYDFPATSPLRYAVAAAYGMDLVAEECELGPYADYVPSQKYEEMGTLPTNVNPMALHMWLCHDQRFDKVVRSNL